MPPERDDESGKFTEEYPREAFLKAIESTENATTKNVADEVGCSYDLAYRRLTSLAEDSEITCIEIGSSFVWTV